MREIKFRAWDKENKKMRTDFYICAIDGECMDLDEFMFPEWILQQYIGLKDKNGTEIYEGDILKYDYGEKLRIIEWQDKKAQWSIGGYGEEHLEIIGNIYENPELLK